MSSSGGLLQLTAIGLQDIKLNQNPDFSYFKLIYKKYINFSIKQKKLPFSNRNPNFGVNSINISLTKEGDFLKNLVLKTTITGKSSNSNGKWNYTRNLGFSLIKKIQFKIGNVLVDTIYGTWLHIWKELFNSSEKNLLLDKLIGNTKEALEFNSNEKILDLYIPLPFFTDNIALPLINLIHSEIFLIIDFNNSDKLINKQAFYFNENAPVNVNPDISNQTYNISLEMKNTCILADYFLIDSKEKAYFLNQNYKLLIENHEYQENFINSNDISIQKEIFLKHPTKFISFVIQPTGTTNGGSYLNFPNTNYFENAAKKFCLRFCATGWVGNNDFTLSNSKYGVFQNDSGEAINGIGYKLAFDHGLTSLKNLGIFTEHEKIIYDLFNKLNPIITKYYGNNIISTTIKNIKVNINNLTEQDKYILSLSSNDLNTFIKSGGNNNSIHTGDNNNEGNPNYDIMVHDNSLFTILLDGTLQFIESLKFKLDNSDRFKYFPIKYFENLEIYKYDLSYKQGINILSFSLNPKMHYPTGTCNFSNINNCYLVFNLKNSNKNIKNFIYNLDKFNIKNNSKFIVISKYYNILEIQSGFANIKYS